MAYQQMDQTRYSDFQVWVKEIGGWKKPWQNGILHGNSFSAVAHALQIAKTGKYVCIKDSSTGSVAHAVMDPLTNCWRKSTSEEEKAGKACLMVWNRPGHDDLEAIPKPMQSNSITDTSSSEHMLSVPVSGQTLVQEAVPIKDNAGKAAEYLASKIRKDSNITDLVRKTAFRYGIKQSGIYDAFKALYGCLPSEYRKSR